ncbi:MAG TPA: DUF3631 domain-containing protein [Vicinamibacterales bacterium]|nr:DUF3631 domain-containing protein [Vicinamibacterales bacterium]
MLTDIRSVFEAQNNPDVLASAGLVSGLVALDDRPWATFTKGDKPITGHRLSRLLRGFDVHPGGTIRVGEKVFKGYRYAAFAEAFARYLPIEALQRNKTNNDGPQLDKTEALHPESVTDSKTSVCADKHWDCYAVTLSTPDQRAEGQNAAFYHPDLLWRDPEDGSAAAAPVLQLSPDRSDCRPESPLPSEDVADDGRF